MLIDNLSKIRNLLFYFENPFLLAKLNFVCQWKIWKTHIILLRNSNAISRSLQSTWSKSFRMLLKDQGEAYFDSYFCFIFSICFVFAYRYGKEVFILLITSNNSNRLKNRQKVEWTNCVIPWRSKEHTDSMERHWPDITSKR